MRPTSIILLSGSARSLRDTEDTVGMGYVLPTQAAAQLPTPLPEKKITLAAACR